jgi:hypothetical protein
MISLLFWLVIGAFLYRAGHPQKVSYIAADNEIDESVHHRGEPDNRIYAPPRNPVRLFPAMHANTQQLKTNYWLQGLGVAVILSAPWLLGILGTLSFATLGFAAGLRQRHSITLPLALWFWVGGGGLYASALGFISIDFYAAGDAPRALLAWMGLGLLLAWRAQHWPLVLAWLLGLLMRWNGLLESSNLWDLMLDPLACIALSLARSSWSWRA